MTILLLLYSKILNLFLIPENLSKPTLIFSKSIFNIDAMDAAHKEL